MTPERYELVCKLFLEALALESGPRAAFLDQACAGDDSLRAEIEQLLANDAKASEEGFLQKPSPLGDIIKLTPEAPDSMIGRRIGAYEINRRIGGGGMGDVYLAVRRDDIQLRVAVKLVRRGMDSAEIIRRFRNEWQILAALRHPNIARFLDCGTTEDGLPFLMMEYIDGKPIDQYCDDHKLTTRQRLELFRLVCAAVLFAHQQGVIHRDLSPDNIRVTEDGVPKLLDFGIAKLINLELGFPPDDGPTRTECRFMKPEYASPEQVRGEMTLTTATDVYSLGVVLYRLLTGHPPYRIKSHLKRDIERAVCEAEPAYPSTEILHSIEIPRRDGTTVLLTPDEVAKSRDGDPKKLRRSLAGDIDKILLMALRKEPERRYNKSVEQFADDILRHLKGLPVAAEKDTVFYRTKKFVKRNRVTVTAAGLVVLSLVSGIVGTTTSMLRAWDAEAQARNKEAAKQIALEDARSVLDFFQDHVLAAARPEKEEGGLGIKATIRDAVHAAEPKIAGAFADRPLVEASIRQTLGTTYWYLGENKAAIDQLERALTLRTDRLGPDDPETLTSMNQLALVYQDTGRREEAMALFEKTLVKQKEKLPPDHPDTLSTMNNLALAYRDAGELEKALPLLQETLTRRKERLGLDDRKTLLSMNNLALAYLDAEQLDKALSLFEEALAIQRKNLRHDDPETLNLMTNLASAYRAARRLTDAVPLLEEALARQKKKLPPDHPDTLFSMNELGEAYLAAGRLDKAVPLFELTLKKRREKLPPDHPHTLSSMLWLANAYQATGKFDEAARLFEQVLAKRKEKLPPDHPHTLSSMNTLACAYLAAGRLKEAVPLFEEMLEKLPPDHPDTLIVMNNLAIAYRDAGKLDKALPLLEETLRKRKKLLGATDPNTLFSMNSLASMYLKNAEFAKAELMLRECLTIRQEKLPDDWMTFHTQSQLGGSLLGQKKYAEAERLLLAGYEGMKQREARIPATAKNYLTDSLERLVQLYETWGKKDQADQWRRETQARSPSPE